VWVEFNKIDFSEKGKVKKLSLDKNENYAGESSMNFKEAKVFRFAGLD
jgi:choloylglycine hydrolase